MALYVIGDLHLSLSGDKTMDIFPGWKDYVSRIKENWLVKIRPEDTVVLAGDTSWGMNFNEAKADFAFIDALPGQKIILKGNHDYWWATMNKMNAFFQQSGFSTLHILHNNHYLVEGVCICGSRGWIFDQGEPADQKVIAREAGRLELSLQSAGDLKRGSRMTERSSCVRPPVWKLLWRPGQNSPGKRSLFFTIRRCMGSSWLRRFSISFLNMGSAAVTMATSTGPAAVTLLMAVTWGSNFG